MEETVQLGERYSAAAFLIYLPWTNLCRSKVLFLLYWFLVRGKFSLVGKPPPLNKIFMNCGILISLVSAEPIHVAISMPVFFQSCYSCLYLKPPFLLNWMAELLPFSLKKSNIHDCIFLVCHRLSKILEKYQTNSGKILWDEKHKVTFDFQTGWE